MAGGLSHIKVEFNRNAANIVKWYALDQQTLRKAQLWQGQQQQQQAGQQTPQRH